MRVKAQMPVSFLYFFALEFKIMDHRMRVKKKKKSVKEWHPSCIVLVLLNMLLLTLVENDEDFPPLILINRSR